MFDVMAFFAPGDPLALRHLWVPTAAVLTTLALAPGCAGDKSPTAPRVQSPPADEPDAGDEDEPKSALQEAKDTVIDTMPHHFDAARTLEHQLVAGELDAARTAATKLAASRARAYPEPWAPFVMRLRRAAESAAKAEDLAAASTAAGEIAGSCGECHQSLAVKVAFEPVDRPADDAGMQLHRWAVERMWEGIVGPSDDAWREGTKSFAPLPECMHDLGGEQIDKEAIEGARARASELAATAAQTEPLEARAAIYGSMLGTCATCHAAGC